MAIRDVSDYAVYVSATGGAGTYTLIQDLESSDATHGNEGTTRRRVFGNPNAHVRLGDDTDEYELGGLYNPDDTNGQNILRTAKDNGTTVFLAFVHDNSAIEKGYSQECYITEYGENAEADGEWVECSFSAEGKGSRVALGAGGLP